MIEATLYAVIDRISSKICSRWSIEISLKLVTTERIHDFEIGVIKHIFHRHFESLFF